MVPLAVALVVSGLPGSPQKPDTGKAVYCEVEETSVSGGKTERKSLRFWSQGASLYRRERDESGFTMIDILNGKEGWILETGGKTGYHFRKPSPQYAMLDSSRREIFESTREWLRKGGKKIGGQVLGGVLCDVYRRPEPSAEGASTLFVSSRSAQPVRILAAGSFTLGKRKITFKTTWQFKKWQVGRAMHSSLFSPPSDFRIREIPTKPGIQSGKKRKP